MNNKLPTSKFIKTFNENVKNKPDTSAVKTLFNNREKYTQELNKLSNSELHLLKYLIEKILMERS